MHKNKIIARMIGVKLKFTLSMISITMKLVCIKSSSISYYCILLPLKLMQYSGVTRHREYVAVAHVLQEALAAAGVSLCKSPLNS